MLWKHHNSWQAALTSALREKGVKLPKEDRLVTENDIRYFHAQLQKTDKYSTEESYTLDQPADGETIIFKDEPSVSLVARWAGSQFSLVIMTPLIQADGSGWNRIYDTVNRPPIYSRFSTGNQGLHEPLLLGCLPKETILLTT
jgi:hypothetical protein